jgi:hypothetical protein
MRFDRQVVESIAKEVLDAYLDGINPNEKITQLTEMYSYTPSQIRRICESSNVAIKRYLSGKSEDQNFTFPLADAEGIIGGISGGDGEEMELIDKQASYEGDDWEWFDDNLGHVLMEKTADTWVNPGGVAAILIGLDQAINDVRQDLNGKSSDLSKVAMGLDRLIKKSFHEDGNINKIYSIATSLVPEDERITIENLFKQAHNKLEVAIQFPIGDLEQVKLAGVVNKNSRFAELITEYVDLHKDVTKYAMALASLEDKKSKVAEMFSQMYVEE